MKRLRCSNVHRYARIRTPQADLIADAVGIAGGRCRSADRDVLNEVQRTGAGLLLHEVHAALDRVRFARRNAGLRMVLVHLRAAGQRVGRRAVAGKRSGQRGYLTRFQAAVHRLQDVLVLVRLLFLVLGGSLLLLGAERRGLRRR